MQSDEARVAQIVRIARPLVDWHRQNGKPGARVRLKRGDFSFLVKNPILARGAGFEVDGDRISLDKVEVLPC